MSSEYGTRQLLDHFFSSQRPLFSLSSGIWNPPVNVSESPDRIFIRMEVAGVCPSDISVTLEGGVLIVRGRRYDRAPTDNEEFHLVEIRYGRFERAFRLPDSVLEDKIHASYRCGFLDIEIPKGKGTGQPVKIRINE